MDNFIEIKARKEGKVTLKALHEDIGKKIERGEINALISIGVNAEGDLLCGWSSGIDFYSLLGILDAGKDEIKAMIDEED